MSAEREFWERVIDDVGAQKLLDESCGMHDTVSSEVNWTGAERVDDAGRLHLSGFGDLSIDLCSQYDHIGRIRLRFSRVESFEYDYDSEYIPSFHFEGGSVISKFGNWLIKSSELSFAIESTV